MMKIYDNFTSGEDTTLWVTCECGLSPMAADGEVYRCECGRGYRVEIIVYEYEQGEKDDKFEDNNYNIKG